MYIKSIKVNQKLLKAVLIVLLAAVFALLLMRVLSSGPTDALAVKNMEVNTKRVKTNEDRINFIRQFGWEVEESAIEVAEVAVPKQFDQVYEAYNAMQKEQGLDLEKYRGKSAKRWSYRVLNYPGEVGEIHCNLLLVGNRIVAADISKVELDGFMHGLEMPQPTIYQPEPDGAGPELDPGILAESEPQEQPAA